MFPFVLVSIYYTKKKDERNLLNDLAGIAIFALAGMGSYYFSDRTFDEKIWWVWHITVPCTIHRPCRRYTARKVRLRGNRAMDR